MTNLIIWQKWTDPFGIDDIDSLLSDNTKEFEENTNEEGELIDHSQEPLLLNKKNIKVIATPMGIIPINENTASGKIFNFWLGHTNFDITKQVAYLIEKAEGVESLDVFTRYRFRISVGKAFEDSVVMRTINSNVYAYLEEIENTI
jgi:hypothetical protein